MTDVLSHVKNSEEIPEEDVVHTMNVGSEFIAALLSDPENLTDDEAAHYGVLGMKWGVRRDRTGHIKARATLDRRGRKEMSLMADIKNVGYRKAYNAIYKKAAGKIRQGTRKLNNDPRFKGQDFRKPSKLRSQYYSEYSKMVTQQLNAATALKGVKGSKRLTMDWTFDVEKENLPRATIKIKDTRQGRKEARASAKEIRRSVRHAADDEENEEVEGSIDIEFDLDEMGHILDFHIADDDAVEHAMALGADFIDQMMSDPEDLSDDELAHYGVLGMKWGVRKDRGGGRPQGGASRKKAPLSSVKKMVTRKGNTTEKKAEPEQKPASNTSSTNQSTPQTQQASTPARSGSAMSDQELRDAINRMQMEKTYSQLMAERNPAPAKKADSVIKKIVSDSAKQAVGQILTNTAKTVGTYAIAAAISKSNPALANAMMKGVGDNAVKKAESDKPKDDGPDATVSTPKSSQPKQSGQNGSKSSSTSAQLKSLHDEVDKSLQKNREESKQMSDVTRSILEEMERRRNN